MEIQALKNKVRSNIFSLINFTEMNRNKTDFPVMQEGILKAANELLQEKVQIVLPKLALD